MTHSNKRTTHPRTAAPAAGTDVPMLSAGSAKDRHDATAPTPAGPRTPRRSGGDILMPTLGQCAVIVLCTAVIVALTVRWIGAVETLVVVGITAALVLVILTLRTPPAEPWTQFTALFRLLARIVRGGGSDQP